MIAAIVLAAGESRRLGQPKQLVQIDGVSLIRRTVAAAMAAGCEPIVVVQGCVDLREELNDLPVRIITNHDWPAGPGGSIRAGVTEVSANASVDAAVLLVCDQPRLAGDVITTLIRFHETTSQPIVACAYANAIGTPCLFDRSLFSELAALPSNAGAKRILQNHSTRVAVIDWADGALDIDTPADLAALPPAPLKRTSGILKEPLPARPAPPISPLP